MTWSDKQLNAHKKASAGLSVATSTLGIGALGIAGARAGGSRGLKLAHKAGRLKNVTPKHVKRFQAKSTGIQTGLLTASAGLGGVGGFNYAGIQNAEAKRSTRVAKRERPRKLTPVEQKQVKRSANKGDAIGTAAGLAATAAFPGVRRAAAGSARLSRALYQGGKAGTSGGRLALGGARPSVKSRLKTVGSNAKLAGSSAAKGVGAGGMYMLEKHPKQALGAYGALVVGSQGGAQIGHTKKRREILRKSEDGMDFGLGQVRQGEISKAYDPERKRKRRLDVYQAGATAAAPGLAGGAVFAGRGPAKQVKTLVRARHPKGYGSGQRPTVLPLGPKAYRAGLKHVATSRQTGITAALGLGAVGAAVGADRIKRYKRGNGRSYRPLHAQI